jgi:DNA-binding MarR family transcriptional regulator
MTPRHSVSFQATSRDSDAAIEDSIARVLAGWRATRPELEIEPIAITARLARLQAVLSPRLETVFARYGMRGADFAVIATLIRLADESVSQRELASELGLSAGTVSLRIDRLVQRGLAERRPDPDDGRGALVSLTDRGRELFEACAPEHLANAHELLAGLSEPERDQLGTCWANSSTRSKTLVQTTASLTTSASWSTMRLSRSSSGGPSACRRSPASSSVTSTLPAQPQQPEYAQVTCSQWPTVGRCAIATIST